MTDDPVRATADDPVRATADDVHAWLAEPGVDDDGSLRTLDTALTTALPDATRRLWRGTFWGGTTQAIIGYGDIVQARPQGADAEWFLLGLARQARYVSLYVNAAEGRDYLSRAYAERLAAPGSSVKAGAAALTFLAAADVDLDVLAELAHHAGRVQPYA